MKNNRVLMPERGLLYGYLAPLLTIAILVGLVIIAIVSVKYRFRADVGTIIADDIEQLSKIFERIEKECDILGFDLQQTPINFLNVKKDGFVGSELGSMNMGHPEKWAGPYLVSNPEIEDKVYMIVATKFGHYITPGNGVMLPNGKKLGKDIKLNKSANIDKMMADEGPLNYKGKPLAAKLTIKAKPAVGIDPEEFMDAD